MAVYIVGVTGASGAIYAKHVLNGLLYAGHSVECVISSAGRRVMNIEENVDVSGDIERDFGVLLRWCGAEEKRDNFTLFHEKDIAARIASGSYSSAGMVIVPCSGGTLGRIAQGMSGGLIERAADVCLKERRPLVLVPREAPINLVHIRNMAAATEAGAVILPASPGFYHHPRTIEDLVDMIAGRILSALKVDSALLKKWRGIDALPD